MRVFDLENTPINPDKDNQFDEYLLFVTYSIRSSYHQTYGHSPSQLAFGRDVFIDSKVETDWEKLEKKKKLNLTRAIKEKMLVVSIILIK